METTPQKNAQTVSKGVHQLKPTHLKTNVLMQETQLQQKKWIPRQLNTDPLPPPTLLPASIA
jgi:hypothetical protein